MSALQITARVHSVVDGDTIRVEFEHNGSTLKESLRILALDTEEVSPGSKPVTKMGQEASKRAKSIFGVGDEVVLTFPDDEPLDVALIKHRGNFGRLLVYLTTPDGQDFEELMIREGFSPYFVKYGQAHSSERHIRYLTAERDAQAQKLGIWDQITNNGAVMRDYANLGTWWELCGKIIEEYRTLRRTNPHLEVFNTRLDYDKLVERAKAQEETTVFMELRSFKPAGSDHMILSTGSDTQPFKLFVPFGNTDRGADIMNLLLTRYISEGEMKIRRSYAYITGPTKMFPENDGIPEIIVESIDQISDIAQVN